MCPPPRMTREPRYYRSDQSSGCHRLCVVRLGVFAGRLPTLCGGIVPAGRHDPAKENPMSNTTETTESEAARLERREARIEALVEQLEECVALAKKVVERVEAGE